MLNPWEIPLLNTVILLTSGATVTWALPSSAIFSWASKTQGMVSLAATIILAAIFTGFHAIDIILKHRLLLQTGFMGQHFLWLLDSMGFMYLLELFFYLIFVYSD